mmetsp:Transcript_56034/g.60641  ORF Transcript_56034/g.60641 Transcript_56034/m.60641 type:complete len:454 (+) Transcript_56034:166-1527(+)
MATTTKAAAAAALSVTTYVRVEAPCDLFKGYMFAATVDIDEDGDGNVGGTKKKTFLVKVPHDVKQGEEFEVPMNQNNNSPNDHYDDGDENVNEVSASFRNKSKGSHSNSNSNLLWRFVCCCNAAPCCFPDGCCPDGCCPDGCMPNGNCGEQFEGFCFCYDFTHDSDQRNDDDHDCKTKDKDNDFGLHWILQALVDSDTTPEAIRVAAISAVKSTQAQLEQNHEQDQKEAEERAKQKAAQDAGEDMGSSSAQNSKEFKSQVDQVKTINGLVTSGVLSKKLGEQKIQKILGIKNGNPGFNEDGTAIVYPLGGCCNYAPCLFPDGCCPDGCCPDGCCPNGCIGEQFKGCCMSIKGKPPWMAYTAESISSSFHYNGQKYNNTAATFTATVAGIVNDEALGDDQALQALKGLLNAYALLKQHKFMYFDAVNETTPQTGLDNNGDKNKKKNSTKMFGIF